MKKTQRAIFNLNENTKTLSKGSEYPLSKELKPRKYLLQMEYQSALILFSIRLKTFDIKVWRKFKYSDTECRLCNTAEETYKHVWVCPALGPPHSKMMDPYSEEEEVMNLVVKRFMFFKQQCDEKEDEVETNDAEQ